MSAQRAEAKRLKYVATLNDDTLPENTPPDYELQYIDIGSVNSLGEIQEVVTYQFEDAPSRARRRVQNGDIVVSTVRTYLKAIAQIIDPPENLIVSTGFAVVRPKPTVLHPAYAKYALLDEAFLGEVVSRSVGVSYPAINASDLGDIEIQVPPLLQQQQLAALLDRETARLDALVAAKQEQLELIAEKRRALITRAVMQGLDESAPRRATGLPWLEGVPAHWEVCYLKRKLTSMDYGISESVSPEGNIGVLRMGDIKAGEVSFDKLGFVDEVDANLLLIKNDLLFNRTNSLDQIGKVGIFRGYGEQPVSFASYLVRLRCNPDLLPEFLNYVLNSNGILEWARAEALPAIGQANLNPSRYSYLTITVPPLTEQESILEYIAEETDRITLLRAATEASLSLMHERRAALIAAAVTGELKLNN